MRLKNSAPLKPFCTHPEVIEDSAVTPKIQFLDLLFCFFRSLPFTYSLSVPNNDLKSQLKWSDRFRYRQTDLFLKSFTSKTKVALLLAGHAGQLSYCCAARFGEFVKYIHPEEKKEKTIAIRL